MIEDKRRIKEVNASSMADIAFLLLIFFLVATTMGVDKGIARILPPLPEAGEQTENIIVRERNLLQVYVNAYDRILAGRQQVDISELKDIVKEFVLNESDDERLPERRPTEIVLPDGGVWTYPVSEGIVSLTNDRETSYEMYVKVQNELTRAFNEIRDEVALERFHRRFDELPAEWKAAVARAVPMRVSEAEPLDVTGH